MPLRPDMTIEELAHDESALDHLAEIILSRGARSAMRVAIGDNSPRRYDKADKIAQGISVGVHRGIKRFVGNE